MKKIKLLIFTASIIMGLLASGQVPADKLATHTLPLDQIQRAYQLMESGESLRVVLQPS